MPILSVALPMFRARDIYWLALEGLCRQVSVNFQWELLIMEEEFEKVGIEAVLKYEPRLKTVGCTKIVHTIIPEWIPLANKWVRIAKTASPESRCFLLQAADCYSQPYRLVETHNAFIGGKTDWVQSPKGYFYDVISKRTVIFDSDYKEYVHPCKLNMAIRTAYVRVMPIEKVCKGVDGWLFKNATRIKKAPLVVVHNRSLHWKLGFDSNGVNRITRSRTYILNNAKRPFLPTTDSVRSIIDPSIIERLDALKPDLGRFIQYK